MYGLNISKFVMVLSASLFSSAAFAEPVKIAAAKSTTARHAVVKPLPAPITNSWVCLSGIQLEVQPVSFDASDAPTAWVVLYRQDGEVVSSERVSPEQADMLPAYDCGNAPMAQNPKDGRSSLIG